MVFSAGNACTLPSAILTTSDLQALQPPLTGPLRGTGRRTVAPGLFQLSLPAWHPRLFLPSSPPALNVGLGTPCAALVLLLN